MSKRSSPGAVEGSVQRNVEKRRQLEGFEIVVRHEREAPGDGPEACGLGGGGGFVLEVGAVHDPRELAQRGVIGTVLLRQRFERAAAEVVLVGITGARGIEADGARAALDVGHITRFDDGEGGPWIDEAPDQPRGRRAVHADLPARHPLHGCPRVP